MKTLLSLTLSLAAASAFLPPQGEPATVDDSLPAGVAALIGDETITFDEYKDFLLERYGAGPLDDMVLGRLFQREAERLGVRLAADEIDAELERFWEHYVVRFRGDASAMERELASAGFTQDSYRRKMRAELARDLLEKRIVLATREISEDALRGRFDREYGVDGVKVEVRHILFTTGRVRSDLRRRGIRENDVTDAEVQAEMKAKALRTLARIRAGSEFVAVARAESHDVSVHQNEGVIPGYNYERYGEEFAAAVRGAEVGVLFGPVASPVGLHLVEVVSRETTKLDDVRADLEARMMAEAPTWQERNELRARLAAAVPVRKYR